MKLIQYLKNRKGEISWFYIVMMVVGLIGLMVLLSILFKGKGKMGETVGFFRDLFS
jgi:hypothetical protein